MIRKIGHYTKEVIEHFQNPHNYGKIKNPEGIGKVGNIVCGDVMLLYIKIGKDKKKKEIIKDIRFETFGCVAAISTSSIITDLVKGKTLKEAIEINKDKVARSQWDFLENHCSNARYKVITKHPPKGIGCPMIPTTPPLARYT